MYGYIRPLKAELKVREYEAYHAMYCGLCRTLGRRYGFAARFLVSYDLTFLCCLLEGSAVQWRQETCFCPANPFCRKRCVEQSEAMAHAADLTVLLAWQKLRDAVLDERGPKQIAAWLGTRLYGRAYRRAAARLPEQAAQIERQLGRLAALEAAQSASLDETADAFAQILAGCDPAARGRAAPGGRAAAVSHRPVHLPDRRAGRRGGGRPARTIQSRAAAVSGRTGGAVRR